VPIKSPLAFIKRKSKAKKEKRRRKVQLRFLEEKNVDQNEPADSSRESSERQNNDRMTENKNNVTT